MVTRLQQRAGASHDSWELTIDPQEADRRKRERIIRLNAVIVPRMRVLGYGLVSLTVLLHNILVFGDPRWTAWLWLNAALAVYCAVSWYALHLFYAEAGKYFDLGRVVLALDLFADGLAIYASGAEASWLFFISAFRVVDQAQLSTRRALLFAHLAPLSYLGVMLYVAYAVGRPVPAGPQVAKLLAIYIAGLYTAMLSRGADRRSDRLTEIVRVARRLVGELGQKTEALEASSRELRKAVETQSRLAQEKAQLYAAAHRDRNRHQQIFDSTSDGIIFIGRTGRIEAANIRAGELLGFDPTAVIGSEMSTLVSRLYSVGDGDSFLPTLHRLIVDPWTPGQGDLRQPSTGRILSWSAQPARDPSGDISGLTFTFQDVTRARDLVRQLEDTSRQLEEARERSEAANRAKGEFLANVSHEIHTPLSAVIGMAQFIQDHGHRDDMVRRIRTSAEGLMTIINDILDFSRIESRTLALEPAPFSLRGTLADAIDVLRVRAWERNLELHLEVAADVPDALVGDALRLRQVLLNLLGNALKFTERGDVRLRVGVATALPDQVCLHFGVSDTGIGIVKGKQDVVFDAFSQADGTAARRFGGAGLGLSISRRLVEMMRGDLWVESEAGEGSTFRFTATFGLGPAAEVPARSAAAGPAPSKSLTVLVAEDENVQRELLTALLTHQGHTVVTATNGREALEELARTPVQVALIDLQMPGLDGFETARTIRAWERTAGGHLRILGMSTSSFAEEDVRSRDAGIDRFEVKPIARDLLVRLVTELGAASDPVEIPPELAGRPAFLAAYDHDLAAARRVVDVFLEQSPGLMAQIGSAIERNDSAALRLAAHALRGIISNFPMGPARVVAARMEACGFDDDLAGASEALPQLEQEVARLRAILPALV